MSRSIFTVAVGNLALPLAAFATAPIIAHSLGVSGRGEVAAGTSLLLLLSAVGTLGLTDAATYFIASRLARPGVVVLRVSFYLLATGVLLTVVNYLAAPWVAGGDTELTVVIRLAGFAIAPTLVIGAFRGAAQASHRWGVINAEKYVTATFRIVPLIVLLWMGLLTPITAVMTLAWTPVLGGLAYLALLRSGDANFVPRRRGRPRLLRYGLGVWIGSLSGILLSRLDQAVMTPLAGVYELGLYAVAVNLTDLVLITQSALGQVLFAADARERNDERMYLGSRLSVMVTLVSSITIAAPIYLWISLLFGSAFLPAIPAVLLLLLANIAGAPGSVAGTATSARGYPIFRSTSILVAAIVNVILVFLLTPTLGAMGAAAATLAGNVVASGMNVYFAHVRFGMSVRKLCLPRLSDLQALLTAIKNR
ncbi:MULTISPECIES: oligosaccharide flippase family protein [Microbacterium]|uniref:oligosaccharide flippase family protein n=1 Tax=Microbacterium TaxID=33882 RepID=UPI001485107D|nr:oligosaccharide flippase family protein [Microbacterium sp. 4NA327F11]MCK9919824.1 oligosaccharide flippase family protein [Microbacteriaceae bacterium K1510]